jgi:hypothetical protein
MIKPFKSELRCVSCSAMMRFSCEEMDEPGFVHDVFECTKCRSTQSYITAEMVPGLVKNRRGAIDRRSGTDTRPEVEKQNTGERRSRIERRSNPSIGSSEQPSKDQLSLFVKRIRRAMRDEKSRYFFGVALGENDFSGYADVLRSLAWIEDLANGQR